MAELTLFDKLIPLEWLIATPDKIDRESLTPYETDVLRFCQQWLSGQDQFVLHTSGSTGKPKSITLTRQQMITSAQLTGQALGLTAGDKSLVCLSTQYIAGMMMLVRGFELDLHSVVVEPSSNPLEGFSAECSFDFTALVPLQLQTIINGPPEQAAILNQMKAILIGGAPVSVALQAQLQALDVPIYHTYGMTETVTHIALRRLNGPRASDYFVPFEGITLTLDERGCLAIASSVTLGKTYQTNDLVDLKADGSFKWLGRVDNVINSGGVKIQLEKVERALEQFFYHYQNGRYAERRFFVGALQDEQLGERLVAVIEGGQFPEGQDTQNFRAILQQALQPTLNRYEVPRQIYFIDQFAETPTGKIDRKANLAQIEAKLRLSDSMVSNGSEPLA